MKTLKITTITAFAIFSLTAGLTACSKQEAVMPESPDTGKGATVKISPLNYTGGESALEGENTITDMQACLFESGVLTKVFEDLNGSDAGYHIQTESQEGTVYMLANLKGQIDLNSLLLAGTSEEEFHKTAISAGADGKTVNFFTGSVTLSGQEGYSYTAEIKRGVARFDLSVNSSAGQEVAVKKIEITNVAQKGSLNTPAEGIYTPEAAQRTTVSATFDTPATDSAKGFLYIYEQKNTGMEIRATVEIAGREKVLTKSLNGDISRNNIYTIRINKDNIDIYINVGIADWEDGEDTNIDA